LGKVNDMDAATLAALVAFDRESIRLQTLHKGRI
jgi:hypothetical protein